MDPQRRVEPRGRKNAEPLHDAEILGGDQVHPHGLHQLQGEEEAAMNADEVDYEALANLRAELLQVQQQAETLRPAATTAPVTAMCITS